MGARGAGGDVGEAAEQDAPRAAPAFNTGGGGFIFEDLVGAWATAALLAGVAPLGSELGVPTTIQFQAGALGHHLDDLVVVGSAQPNTTLAASLKSFDMLSAGKILPEFVAAAWKELLGERFRERDDYLGMVCGQAAQGNLVALERLIIDCRADLDETMAQRIQTEGAYNATHRSLWASAACPKELADEHGVDVASSPARLLRHLIARRLDLMAPGSDALASAKQWCAEALAAEQVGRAEELWEALYAHIAQLRPAAGSVGWTSILNSFADRFVFRMRRDVAPAWGLIDQHTGSELATVRDELGNDGLRLDRAEAWGQIGQAGAPPVMILTGPSGSGKSALAKRWLQEIAGGALWLDAGDLPDGLSGVRARLGLSVGVGKALELSPQPARVVVDGLDRTYNLAALKAAALLARQAAESDGRLRVIITCQQMELPRVAQGLVQAGAQQMQVTSVGNLDDADVAQVLRDRPELARLAVGGQLLGVLRRPKLLDLVLRASASDEAILGELEDETDVARLWWEYFVQVGPGGGSRVELVLRLAMEQADELAPDTPAGELGAAEATAVDALRGDGVLAPTTDRYAFAHDLFGDWSRFQRLGALGDGALAWMDGKDQLPPWHRAIRLFALSRLRAGGVAGWSEDRAELERREQPLLALLFLDAVVFAQDGQALLEELWPTLLENGGALLRRLLRRFISVATIPDPLGSLIFPDAPEIEIHFAVQARVPIWAFWPPVIEVLEAHREQAIEHAPQAVAAVVDLWLRRSEPGWPSRRSAAHLGLALGDAVMRWSSEGRHMDEEFETKLFRAALAAGGVLPAEIAELLAGGLSSGGEEDATGEESEP